MKRMRFTEEQIALAVRQPESGVASSLSACCRVDVNWLLVERQERIAPGARRRVHSGAGQS